MKNIVNGYKVISAVVPKDMYDDMMKECELAGQTCSEYLRDAARNQGIFLKQRRLADEWSKLVRK